MNTDTLKNIGIFIGCLLLCQAAGALGVTATIPNLPVWYASLNKPSFNPPNGIFGPVWGFLYLLMAVAFYKVIKSQNPKKNLSIGIFLAQLILNTAWSFLFFEFHLLAVSLVEIILMLAAIIYFTITVAPISRVAMYCFFPYIAWVSFATVLNAAIWRLN